MNAYGMEDHLSESDLDSVREMAEACTTELRAFYVLVLAGQYQKVLFSRYSCISCFLLYT